MTNAERHKKICYELNRIYETKNRDYGDSFAMSYKDYGLIVAAIRIGDKYNRLHNLVARGQDILHVCEESIRDTLLDLANYAILTVMEMDAESEPKPLQGAKVTYNEPFKPEEAEKIFRGEWVKDLDVH